MRTPARLALAIGVGLLLVAIASLAVSGSPGPVPTLMSTPAPTGTTAPPPPTESFISKRHGLTLRYPGDWVLHAATTSTSRIERDVWSGLDTYDVIATAGSRVLAISGRLPADQSPEDWIGHHDALSSVSAPPCRRSAPSEAPRIAIGDRDGLLTVDECHMTGEYDRWFRAYAQAGDRVYLFQLDTRTLDRAWFEAFLASVTLDPATPDAAIPLPMLGSYTSERYGFAVSYPDSWVVRPAGNDADAWSGLPGFLGYDALGPVDGGGLFVSSVDLAAGEDREAWLAAAEAARGGLSACELARDSWVDVEVGGHPGYLIAHDCAAPSLPRRSATVIAVTDQRAYVFRLNGFFDRASFERLLAEVTLDLP